MQSELFNFTTDSDYDQYSELGQQDYNKKSELWNVDDRVAHNPNMRFQREQNSFVEMIYEGGGTSVMEGAPLPKGLVTFLETRFLSNLGVKPSRFASLKDVVDRCFHYLDWEEPYFFLVDMPVSLTQDNYVYSYRMKETGSTLKPDKLETFSVQMGWKFPHYSYAHKVVTDPRVKLILQGQQIPHAKTGQPMTMYDILETVCEAVFGNYRYVEGMVEQWKEAFYDDAIWDNSKTKNAEELDHLRKCSEEDLPYWLAVTIGIMTWLKSPHGLKFLVQYHPIYYEVLEWDFDADIPKLRKESGGWALVDGWTIFTGKDVERLPGVPPGTCSVSKQHLHCTERVNAKAVMSKCYCGEPRDIYAEDYYLDERRSHPLPTCRKWEDDNPAQMAFISYAAMYNILNQLDTKTACQRHSCPNTKCSYHAGSAARIRALTDSRIKMLTTARTN